MSHVECVSSAVSHSDKITEEPVLCKIVDCIRVLVHRKENACESEKDRSRFDRFDRTDAGRGGGQITSLPPSELKTIKAMTMRFSG